MLQISVKIDDDGTIDIQSKTDGRYEDWKREQREAYNRDLKDAITALCNLAFGAGTYYFKGDIR